MLNEVKIGGWMLTWRCIARVVSIAVFEGVGELVEAWVRHPLLVVNIVAVLAKAHWILGIRIAELKRAELLMVIAIASSKFNLVLR